MSRNPVRFSSRDFSSVMNDLNSDPELANKPEWIKRLMAGPHDVQSAYIDRAVNNIYIQSIDSRKYMERRCEMLDYILAPHSTSSGILRFNIDPDNLPGGSISSSDLVALWSDGGASLQFESRTSESFSSSSEFVTVDNATDIITVANTYDTGDLIRVTATALPGGILADTNYYAIKISSTDIKLAQSLQNSLDGISIDITSDGTDVNLTNYALKVTSYQQKSIDQYFLGTPTTEIWQEFTLRDENILHETVSITINAISWTRVDDWLMSSPTDKDFRVRQLTTGEYIEFGDAESFGAIPDADIYVSYAVGGGSTANIKKLYSINKYLGNNASILDVINITEFTGGLDRESIEKARRLAPLLIGKNELFLEEEYSIALIIARGGVTHAHIDKNFYGVLTSRVVIVPAGGGVSTPTFKSELGAYLESRSFGIAVTVVDANYVPQNITSGIKVLTGFDFSVVKVFYELALSLMLDEIGLEILDTYESTGIADAVDAINFRYSLSFTDQDYNEIESLLVRLVKKRQYAKINDSIELSDFYGIVEDISGVDYVNITSPVFPIATGLDEITSVGTFTTTEL